MSRRKCKWPGKGLELGELSVVKKWWFGSIREELGRIMRGRYKVRLYGRSCAKTRNNF